MTITKCFQIIQSVLSNKMIVDEFFVNNIRFFQLFMIHEQISFEAHLEKLFQFLDLTRVDQFDEYLIKIVNATLKSLTADTDAGSSIYVIIQKYFEKILINNNNSISVFFTMFHYFCQYGKRYIARKNKQLLEDVACSYLLYLFNTYT